MVQRTGVPRDGPWGRPCTFGESATYTGTCKYKNRGQELHVRRFAWGCCVAKVPVKRGGIGAAAQLATL